ncbi:hypothetical protein, variant 1 [Aphanomyces invadans]|uniref:PH domain-containing protein n=1 Tax=Aphanomyces invadans TaxID=157072 RepID=A0A024U683_9STRA|nr:hypothetical protein, variant 1 [Aphanomyces invadans]ETW01891.1 hypothetical protein, variant 1 [Aphanomyces invadans]|eukprot:XP_008869739.1 hypothetical protein, variant 1 [Aphanomyces invadans]
MATSPQQAGRLDPTPEIDGGLPLSGRRLLRELWSIDSQEEESAAVEEREESIRPSFQSSVSSARSSIADDQETRMFASLENGISNLDVDFSCTPGSPCIVHAGWLIKRGHNWHTWKRRWFVLTSDAKLEYFKKPNRKKSKGKVDLNDGIVQVQFVDVHHVEHMYAFSITKGFYTLLCSCETGDDADTWVRNLRNVRRHTPPDFEGLDRHVGNFASEATMCALLSSDKASTHPGNSNGWTAQMLRFQRVALSSATGFTPVAASSILNVQTAGAQFEEFSAGTILNFIDVMTQQAVATHRPLFNSSDGTTQDNSTVPFEAILGIRIVLEDRIYLPLQDVFHKHIHDVPTSRIKARLAILRSLPADLLFDASVLATADTDWSDAIATFSALDTASLPTHKMRIFQRAVDLLGPKFVAAPAAYRYMCIHAVVIDLAMQAAILRLVQKHLPFPDLDGPVRLLLDAVTWVANFNPSTSTISSSSVAAVSAPTLPSVVSVNFATSELGIQFATHLPQDRGARVVYVQKNSQANWSTTVQPGLVLVAVNDMFVAASTLLDIIGHIRRATLPKRLLFVADTDVDSFLTTEFYHFLLCSAADRGDFATVRFILDRCPHIDVHGTCKWTPSALTVVGTGRSPILAARAVPDMALHAAVHGGNIDLVRYLLDDIGLDANRRNPPQLATPLHMLVSKIAEIAPLLVSNGAGVDVPDKDGRTPLHVQCRVGSKEGIVTLVGLGASVNGPSAVAWATGATPLMECVRHGDVSLVDFLLLKGARVNHENNDKETALHVAAMHGHVSVMERLVEAGASLTACNRDGWIPVMVWLHHFRRNTNLSCDDFLRGFRCVVADPATMRCNDVWGRYVVHFAATSLDPKTMKGAMEYCLEKGANGHVEDVFGDTAKEYRKHPKDHGVYVPPTSYMKHLNVTLVELGDTTKRWRVQNGKIEDILAYLVADKSTDLSEMMSFVLNFQAYMDMADLLSLFKARFGHHDTKSKLKQAWSAMGVGNLLRDNCCGGVLFLSLLGLLYPQVMGSDTFVECVAAIHGTMPVVNHQIGKLQHFYNLGPPTTLYKDLYQHMTEMYSTKGTEFTVAMTRMSPSTSAFDFARQCTLLTHALFSHIPIRHLLVPKCQDIGFLSARHWFQHVSEVVINSILLEDSPVDRVRVICYFIDVAEICFAAFQNFDTFIAIVYALQSTPIFRLKITFAHVDPVYTEKLRKLQVYTQSGSRTLSGSTNCPSTKKTRL